MSLLKILLTNFCFYDCVYCVNRRSSDVPRARFTVREVVDLTLSFYRRNCIEGLFLSSGTIQSADHTMEQMVEVARTLREDREFRGYIHLKTIPEASADWALANREHFPVDVNTADRSVLLRVPGLGVRVVNKILSSRRQRRLRYEDLRSLGASLRRARYFIAAAGYRAPRSEAGSERLRADMLQAMAQRSLF